MDVPIMSNRLSRFSLRMAIRTGIIAVNIISCPAIPRPKPKSTRTRHAGPGGLGGWVWSGFAGEKAEI